MGANLKTATTAYAQGRFDEARAACRELLAGDPANAAALEQLGTVALLENDCTEARNLLRQSLENRSAFGRLWPFSTQTRYRIAMTHYRQDDFGGAAACFREAAGPFNLGPFRELRALAAQSTLLAEAPAYVVEGSDEASVPFIATDPLPLIEVFINGTGPLNMIIDTGGAELVLDRKIAQQVGAQSAGAIRSDYAGQKTTETGLGRVGSVDLGDIILHHVPIHTLDTGPMSSLYDARQVHGIVGTRLLMHFLATIDYAGGALVLRRSAPNGSHDASGIPGVRIPFWQAEMHCMLAWGTVNDLEPMLFFVDTGLANAGFTASTEVLQRAGIALDWSKATTGPGGAGEVRSCPFTVDRLVLGTGAHSVGGTHIPGLAIEGSVSILEGKLGFKVGGLISHRFFRNRALTFDFGAMNLIVG